MEKEAPHPIMQAVLDGNLRLLKEMAPVVADGGGIWYRALMLAAMDGRLDFVRYLVEDLRLNVNQRTDTSETAVFISASYGTASSTRYLLDHGADPSLAGRMGSALHGAAMAGQCDVVELLLSRGIDVDLFDSVHGTPLHAATNQGQVGTMKTLLEHHADPNKVFCLHSNPLGMAIQKKSLECVKVLIKAGADVNYIDHIGVTYVMVAANNGLPEIMKCLLDAGANPNILDDFGTTAIEIATLRGRRNIVEMLFPLTSPISRLPNWSVDGIISHIRSFGLKPRDKHQCEAKIAELKLQASEAFKRKEYMIAGELYTCAMKFEPTTEDCAILLANRSFCLLRSESEKMALSDATTCILLRPHWPKGYYRQGAAFMALKDYEKACEAFEGGLRLDPTNVHIKNALREAREAMKNARCAEN